MLSVVIPTFNRAGEVVRTVASVLLGLPEDAELLVIDQTPEPYADLVSVPRLRLIREATPGLPRARNVGVRAARGEVILFLDDDVRALPGLCAAHLAAYADPQVGGVAGRVLVPADPCRLDGPIANDDDPFSGERPRRAPFARGCNMSFRREALLRAGLFDERYVGSAVGEEEDLSFAVRRLGYEIWFCPEAAVIHLLTPTGGCRSGEPNRYDRLDYYANRTYLALKNVTPGDAARIVGDALRLALRDTRTLPPRRVARRVVVAGCGLIEGAARYLRQPERPRRLPYRWET